VRSVGFRSPRRPSSSPYCSVDPRDLPSFPTRRSSDLDVDVHALLLQLLGDGAQERLGVGGVRRLLQGAVDRECLHADRGTPARRSEEHTSELQSRENLVCRLLLEKKKTPYHAESRMTT